MNKRGQTIQIYCPAGEPRGVRIAEITTRIVQAAVVPRSKLDQALPRDEFTGVGVYFLFGESDDGEPMVYIGEADNCASRLKQHHQDPKKDFWNLAVVIGSRTGSLTKAHARLLEFLSIREANEAGRYQLANGNAGSQPPIPEWMQADVMEVFETAGTLLSTVGFAVFEAKVSKKVSTDTTNDKASRRFYCTDRGINAQAVYTEDGLTVLKGSTGRLDAVPSFSGNHSQPKRRARLIEEGLLIEKNGILVLTRDESFSSPSAAANVLMGGTGNGWLAWKDANGRTLHERFRAGADDNNG